MGERNSGLHKSLVPSHKPFGALRFVIKLSGMFMELRRELFAYHEGEISGSKLISYVIIQQLFYPFYSP